MAPTKNPDLADKVIQRLAHRVSSSSHQHRAPTHPILSRNLNCFLRRHLPSPPNLPSRNIVCYYTFRFSDEQSFASPGYACALCQGIPFRSITYLHFHLVQVHPKWNYHIEGPIVDETSGDRGVIITMEENLDMVDTVEEVEFCWIKPRRRPDVNALLLGDRAWYNENSGTSSPSPITPASPLDLSALSNSLPLPPRFRSPALRVTPPTNGLPGGVYLRSRSKRFISYDEVLFDSEEDSDIDPAIFLRARNHETIDEYADLRSAEKRFAKMWNDHLLMDPCHARCYMPQILVRFATMNSEVLRPREGSKGREMWEAYAKHCILLVQQRVIDAGVLKVALETVKNAGKN